VLEKLGGAASRAKPVSNRNREFFENFRLKQAFGETSGCEHPKFARDSNQLHHRPGDPKSDIRLFKPEAKLSVRAALDTSAGATTGLPLLALDLWMRGGEPR
jgi:hypothetical protein